MSATHVALLRGINVGKAKRVSMADLRAIVESCGCKDVRTLLNSGNVVFATKSKDIGSKLEKAIEKKCGFASRVTILSAAEIIATIENNPFEKIANDPARYLVAAFAESDRAKLEPLAGDNWKPGALHLGQRVAYLWCADGILESKLAKAINRALKDGVTARNWATMLKLRAML